MEVFETGIPKIEGFIRFESGKTVLWFLCPVDLLRNKDEKDTKSESSDFVILLCFESLKFCLYNVALQTMSIFNKIMKRLVEMLQWPDFMRRYWDKGPKHTAAFFSLHIHLKHSL